MRARWKGPGSLSTSSGALRAGGEFDAEAISAESLAELTRAGLVEIIDPPRPAPAPPIAAPRAYVAPPPRVVLPEPIEPEKFEPPRAVIVPPAPDPKPVATEKPRKKGKSK